MNRKTIIAALSAVTIVGTSSAFVLLSPARKWFQGPGGDLPVSLLVYSGGEGSVADGDHGVTAVMDASEWWEDELGGTNLITPGTIGSNTIGRDGLNTVSFEDPARIVRNAIAVTLTGWYDGGQSETTNNIDFARIEESDQSYSKKLKFTTEAIGNCNGEYDIQAVQAHEVGHFLGLDHAASGSALMYPSIPSCTFKRIAADDHNGINTIYNDGFSSGGPCTATESRLTQHSYSVPAHGANCLLITVGVTDDCGSAVSGASVSVRLDGQEGGDVLSGSASTGSDGTVTFSLRCRDASSTTYISTVTGITGGAPWSASDPDNTANVSITCVITR